MALLFELLAGVKLQRTRVRQEKKKERWAIRPAAGGDYCRDLRKRVVTFDDEKSGKRAARQLSKYTHKPYEAVRLMS